MARFFRLWVKKRGDRRTGSRLAGGVGEAVFFGILFVLGSASLAGLISDQISHPSPSILVPGYGFWVLVMALTSFVVMGGGGVIYTVMHVGASAERRSALAKRAAKFELIHDAITTQKEYPAIPIGDNLINSPGVTLAFRLPISQSPSGPLIAAMILFLVLTAVTSVLGVITVQEQLAHRPDWLLTAFVLVLIAWDVWCTRQFLRRLWQQTRVGPTCVEISHHPLRPGGEYAIFLSQHGRGLLHGLRMSLQCEEEATYQQGTDTRTESQTVHEQLVFSRGEIRIDPAVPFEMQAQLRIPPRAMHSFRSNHNSVRWKLVVKAEPANWPTFVRSFPVLVYPSTNGSYPKQSQAASNSDGSVDQPATP